jgi:hypothetical protein
MIIMMTMMIMMKVLVAVAEKIEINLENTDVTSEATIGLGYDDTKY